MADFSLNFEEIKWLKDPIAKQLIPNKNPQAAKGEIIKILNQKGFNADVTNTGLTLCYNKIEIYCDSADVSVFALKLACLKPANQRQGNTGGNNRNWQRGNTNQAAKAGFKMGNR